jgi:ophiobolin F synthase
MQILSEPYRYQNSMPSKGIRDKAIDALNFWLRVPTEQIKTIKTVIQTLHCASLMLDDMEDNSPLRRGKPATHVVYGHAQTINSATFQWNQALSEVIKLSSPRCIEIFTGMDQSFLRYVHH